MSEEIPGCSWAIRPFPNPTQVSCDKPRHHLADGDSEHKGVVRDYAYPGSETFVTWLAGDRREFSGEWPGYCAMFDGCTLPAGHHGRHAP